MVYSWKPQNGAVIHGTRTCYLSTSAGLSVLQECLSWLPPSNLLGLAGRPRTIEAILLAYLESFSQTNLPLEPFAMGSGVRGNWASNLYETSLTISQPHSRFYQSLHISSPLCGTVDSTWIPIALSMASYTSNQDSDLTHIAFKFRTYLEVDSSTL